MRVLLCQVLIVAVHLGKGNYIPVMAAEIAGYSYCM